MRLDGGRTIETIASPSAAADGFVVLAALIAEAEVVHRSLGGRHHPQGRKQRIGHRLRRFHIARHHCRRRLRVEQTARRHHQFKRLKTTGIERDWFLHQAAEDVENHCLGDRQRGIEVAGLLR